MSKIISYLKERFKWNKFGKPTRTDKEIQEIFNICKECHLFQKHDENSGKCGVCGCNLSNDKNVAFNKIAWATTHCPLDPPKWSTNLKVYDEEIEPTQSELLRTEQDHLREAKLQKQPPKGGCGCRG